MIDPTLEMREAFRVARTAAKDEAAVPECTVHHIARCPYHITADELDDAGVAAVLAIAERSAGEYGAGYVIVAVSDLDARVIGSFSSAARAAGHALNLFGPLTFGCAVKWRVLKLERVA